MFKKSQFGIVFNTIFSIAFSLLLTGFIKYSQGMLTAESLITGFVPSFGINFTLGTFIPLVVVGNKFAGIFVKNEKSIVFYFLRMFAIVFIMTALMSFLMMFSEIGFKPDLIFAFIFSFPKTFLFAYIAGCAVFPFLLKLTMSLCTING